MKIVRAGQFAPSGNNAQPWKFVVVNDPRVKEKLFEVCGKQKFILEAPLSICIVADIKSKLPKNLTHDDISVDDPVYREVLIKAVRDATIAADHMVMAATDEGLGTCWVALFEQEDIRPVLGVPEHCYVVCVITLGYADESPEKSPRKPLSDIACWNRFGMNPWSCV